MKHFTSTARKDGRWWVVQCDQEPGALSQVARLDQAAELQREAISFVTDIAEEDIKVTIHPVVDDSVTAEIEHARRDRAKAEELAELSSTRFRTAARALSDNGYSLRDVGTILGVSHQRAGQLVKR